MFARVAKASSKKGDAMPLLFEPPAPEEGEDPLADHKRLLRRILLEVPKDLTLVRFTPIDMATVLFSPSGQQRYDVLKVVQHGFGGDPIPNAPVYVLFRNERNGHVRFSQLRDSVESEAA
jgi:hypothetical protein